MKSQKKFASILALILAFAMLIGACDTGSSKKSGKKDRDDDEEEEEEEEETEETEDTEETEETEETAEPVEETEPSEEDIVVEEELSDIAYYGVVLDEILYYTSKGVPEDDIWNLMGIAEISMYSETMEDAMNDVGYILRDVTDDGIPELIVFGHSEYDDSYNVLALYTRKDDQYPWLVFEGWSRNNIRLREDNTFYQVASSGASYTQIDIFKVTDDGYTEDLVSYYTDYEETGNYDSPLCWFDGEGNNLGTVEEYDPEIDDGDYFDVASEYIPMSKNEHNYEVVVADCTYDEAVKMCEEKGGHLLTIDSEEEAYTVKGFIGAKSEFGTFFMEEPNVYGVINDNGGDGDYYMLSISGEDGSLYYTLTSSDPLSENDYMSGFMGFICETEYK